MQWENKVWRKTGFCFILLPIALKAMLHFLKKRWPLQDSMENESFQLRPLTLVRGWARRTNRWTWERAAWEVGGESIECGITEAREMSVLQRRSGQCCQMLLGQRTSPQAQNRLHPAGSIPIPSSTLWLYKWYLCLGQPTSLWPFQSILQGV